MATSVARKAELENLLLELERELEAMAGYEQEYPEHYQNLVNDYEAARQEYLQLSSSGDQSFYNDDSSLCVAELSYDEESALMSYEAPVCGLGDTVSLVDSVWDGDYGESFIVAQGPEAVLRAMRTIPNATPAKVSDGFGGTYTLVPGGYVGTKMFVASLDYLYFLVDRQLIRISKADFGRSELLDAMAEGAQKAAWLEKVGKVAFAFMVPFVGGILGVLGLIAAAATFIVKMSLWYSAHTNEVALARQYIPQVLGHLRQFKKTCPELFGLLMRGLGKNALAAAVEGFSSEDAADLLGRIAGGLATAPSLGFTAILGVLSKAVAVNAILRGGGMVAAGSKEQAKKKLMELRDSGFSITDEEAESIVNEGCLGKDTTVERLHALEEGLKAISVVVEGAADSLRVVE